jgi:hypothetical protein
MLLMALRVRHPEDGTPRQTEHDPAIDPEMFAESLDVAAVVVHVDARPVDIGF